MGESRETWIPVVNYERTYEVSDLGRVRSKPRLVRRSSGAYRVPERILSTSGTYPRVALYHRKERTDFQVSHLVVSAFQDILYKDIVQVFHLDGDPSNCANGNLRAKTKGGIVHHGDVPYYERRRIESLIAQQEKMGEIEDPCPHCGRMPNNAIHKRSCPLNPENVEALREAFMEAAEWSGEPDIMPTLTKYRDWRKETGSTHLMSASVLYRVFVDEEQVRDELEVPLKTRNETIRQEALDHIRQTHAKHGRKVFSMNGYDRYREPHMRTGQAVRHLFCTYKNAMEEAGIEGNQLWWRLQEEEVPIEEILAEPHDTSARSVEELPPTHQPGAEVLPLREMKWYEQGYVDAREPAPKGVEASYAKEVPVREVHRNGRGPEIIERRRIHFVLK